MQLDLRSKLVTLQECYAQLLFSADQHMKVIERIEAHLAAVRGDIWFGGISERGKREIADAEAELAAAVAKREAARREMEAISAQIKATRIDGAGV
jgi:RecA-family ATPase